MLRPESVDNLKSYIRARLMKLSQFPDHYYIDMSDGVCHLTNQPVDIVPNNKL